MLVIASRPIIVEWTTGPDETPCSAIVLSGTVGEVNGPVYEDDRWKVAVTWNEALVTTIPMGGIRRDYAMDVDPHDITIVR